jgi:hypothetical protein
MPTDYYEPSNQNLTAAEVQKLIDGIFHGSDTSYAQTWAADMARIGGAEGGGSTGIVVNTAYPDLPNYYTPQQYFPNVPSAEPEYSLGLFGEDILNTGSYNLVAQALNIPGIPAGQSQPTSAQASSLAKQFAANPSAQAVVAYRMFQGDSNTFAPWTESTAAGTPSPGGLPAGETVYASDLVGTSGSGGAGSSAASGGGTSSSGSGGTAQSPPTDVFTSVMQNLNNLMHPEFSLVSIIKPSSYESLVVMFLVRGAFAVGFAAIGIVGAVKLASGGKLGGRDIPGMVAGFVAGPEAGLMNLANKFLGTSLSPQKQPSEMEQARLGLAQDRLDFQRRRSYVSASQRQQGLIQQASRQATSAQQFQQRMQERQERQQQSAEQFQQRQQAQASRFSTSSAMRAVGLDQAQQRILQGSERAETQRQALQERITSRISQSRRAGVRERRLAGVQAHREQIYPAEYAIRRRRQESSEVRNSLRDRQIALQEWRAGFPDNVDYDQFTVDAD